MSDRRFIEYKGHRVLTSAQLAKSYGVDGKQVSYNFNNNLKRYQLGKHYFALQGSEKRDFLNRHDIHDGSKNASIFYLWTERGAWRHAKSIETDEAWEAYEMLVDEYYQIKGSLATPSYMIEDSISRAERWIQEQKERQALETKTLMLEQQVAEYEPKINYLDRILSSKGVLTITQIAKDYGLTGQELNKILHEERVQYKQNKQWLLYRDYHNKGYTKSRTTNITRTDGRPDVSLDTQWTQKGRLFVHEILKRRGIVALFDRD